MRGERYVVLGLANVRSDWFREVARWSTSASLPIEFVKCLSSEELRARLRSGRAYSALLIDGALPGFDRDLAESARAIGCAVIVIDDGRVDRDWTGIGASTVLTLGFGRRELLDALTTTATPIGRGDAVTVAHEPPQSNSAWRGRLFAVTGPGGTGASTIAAALAQSLGLDARNDGLVLLADLALDADQAMLHDAGDIVPALQELVEAFRVGQPSGQDIRNLTFAVDDRGYRLLLGLRRHRDWTTIRPKALNAALAGLRRTFHAVVADTTGDLEGEEECGSVDVEDRNLLARSAVRDADVVVLVGLPGVKGLHRLVRLVAAAVAHGVPPERILPVINRAPRNPRARAELTAALAELTAPLTNLGTPIAPPLHLAERRHLDDALRDGTRLPGQLVDPIGRAVAATVERIDASYRTLALHDDGDQGRELEPVAVIPGSLGSYYDEDDE